VPSSGWYTTARDIAGWLAALVLLILSTPFILFAALLIKLTSPGPVSYRQTRLGKLGRPFQILKLRTMKHDCEKESGPQWSTKGDTRVTTIGRILRVTHIDELPQLWNVLTGDMALIGPRPERPEFVDRLDQAIPHYSLRMLIRPGITGLAQVRHPADTDLESVKKKLAYDLYYIRRPGLLLDIKITLCTALKMAGISLRILRKIIRMTHVERATLAWTKNPGSPGEQVLTPQVQTTGAA
jgi:lipopolysaccharide/colanic/teichoic acid biosynthesis glycosyltransferase